MGGKASYAAINRAVAKSYDRINLVVPKGRKDELEAFAQSRGLSVNGLINELIRAEMQMSEEDWKRRAAQEKEEE